MEKTVEQALAQLESVLCDPKKKVSIDGSEGDVLTVTEALIILRKIVNTGVTFKGYPVLLGPRTHDGHKAEKLVLTRLDRFLRKHFPSLIYLVSDGQTFVRGALSPDTSEEP